MPNDSSESKRRQRARNADSSTGKPATRAGSSGVTDIISKMKRWTWEGLQTHAAEWDDEVVHGADMMGKITDVRLLGNQSLMVSLVIPPRTRTRRCSLRSTLSTCSRSCVRTTCRAPGSFPCHQTTTRTINRVARDDRPPPRP